MYNYKYNHHIGVVCFLLALYTTIFVGPGHADQLRITFCNILQYALSFVFFYLYIYIKES